MSLPPQIHHASLATIGSFSLLKVLTGSLSDHSQLQLCHFIHYGPGRKKVAVITKIYKMQLKVSESRA